MPMWPVSDRYRSHIWRGHDVAVKVEILADDDVVLDLTDMGVVVDGSVSATYTEMARTASVTIVDRDGSLAPSQTGDLLAPAGNQIRLWRGLVYSPGDIEYVPLITARYTATDTAQGVTQLSSMFDRSWIVAGAKTETVLNIALGSNVVDAIEAVLHTAYPGVPTNFPTTDETTNAMTFEVDSNPWEICQDLAANIGYRLTFDPMGVAVMVPEPDQFETPVWTFDDSRRDNLTLPGHGINLTGLGFNRVHVFSENSDLPVAIHAMATDTDPLSPMQYGGKFGKRPLTVRDEKVASQAQAGGRATRELQAQLGLLRVFSSPIMPWPCGEVLDPVLVNMSRSPVVDNQVMIVDSLTTPVRAKGGAALTTRAQRLVTVE